MFNCANVNCDFDSETLRGWKLHMTKTHDGYTDQELIKATANASSEQGAAATGFKNFAEAEVAVQSDQGEKIPTEKIPAGRKGRESKRSRELNADFTLRMAEGKKYLAETLARFVSFAAESAELDPMNDAETQLLRRAFEFPLEIFQINFAPQMRQQELTNPLFALLVPLSALLTISINRFLGKRATENTNTEKK